MIGKIPCALSFSAAKRKLTALKQIPDGPFLEPSGMCGELLFDVG